MNFFSEKKDFFSAALDYADRGLYVFPMTFERTIDDKGKKRPLCRHGFKDASCRTKDVEGWWRRFPSALIGVATGCESRLFAIDVDSEEADNTWLAFAKKNDFDPHETAWERTPHGFHYYYRYPAKGRKPTLSNGIIGAGIETKGENGSVIISPSSYENEGKIQAYKAVNDVTPMELPPKFFDFVQRLPAWEDRSFSIETPVYPEDVVTNEEGKSLMESCEQVMREAVHGSRHNTFTKLACEIADNVMAGKIEIRAGREYLDRIGCDSGLSPKEVQNVISWAFSHVKRRR